MLRTRSVEAPESSLPAGMASGFFGCWTPTIEAHRQSRGSSCRTIGRVAGLTVTALREDVVDHDTLADSFTEFVRQVEPRLRQALCAAFGGDQGREATADALAFGWEHWERVRTMENPAGYLWGVGRNHARRRRLPRPVFPDPPPEAMPWVEPNLPGAMARLSERQRVAVMLVHGLEWTYGEVAELLGVSKSTVQTQAERGMAKLRKHVGAEDDR